MKTKSRCQPIFVIIALAAGIANSMAQSNIYSLNVVGYYNLLVPASTLTLIANQLNTTNNTIGSLLPAPSPGSAIFKFKDGDWDRYDFDPDDLVWYPDDLTTLNPGEGAFYYSPTATTLTFVGEVMQGSLSTRIAGSNQVSVVSSKAPQQGALFSTLQFPQIDGASLYFFTNITELFTYPIMCFEGYGWFDPRIGPDEYEPLVEPVLDVGQAFLVQNSGPDTNWIRNFTVNFVGTGMVGPSSAKIGQIQVADGIIRLRILNPKGATYTVQFSGDGVGWVTVAANQTTTSWKEPLRAGAQGYYRLVNS